ncbi:mechanosensitive ion channel, partial [Vibrio sp. 2025]
MLNRRIYEVVGLRYDDADKVPEIITAVREMLKNHKDIDTRQTLIVNFDTFGPSSLNFFIYTFTKTVNWVRYHEVKQDVLLKVVGIIKEHNAGIAFPTQTLKLDPIQMAKNQEDSGF